MCGGSDHPSSPFKRLAVRFACFPRSGGAWLVDDPNPTLETLQSRFPVRVVDWPRIYRHPPRDAVQATWVGHATVLVQLDGATFITDPVFGNRASPVSFAGPKRLIPPPFQIDDPNFKHLDFVCISHNHYDHLEKGSVRALHARFPGLRWYVPLGLKAWFKSNTRISTDQVVELDWWESQVDETTGLVITCTPAKHWSSRSGSWDRNRTLWGGFVVASGTKGEGGTKTKGMDEREGPSGESEGGVEGEGEGEGEGGGDDDDGVGVGSRRYAFYFAGDTAYQEELFRDIGRRLGPFDVAALPVGAYDPQWFMRDDHCNPDEAATMHLEVRSARSIPVHWGTFCLTAEPMDEPPALLAKACARLGVAKGEFDVVQHGETVAARWDG